MDIYFIIEIAVRMSYCAGTLTTEEWKAEQQLFLGQGEERTNPRRVPRTSKQFLAISGFGPAHLVRGCWREAIPSANSQVWTTVDSSLAWIAPHPLSIVAAPREQSRYLFGWRV